MTDTKQSKGRTKAPAAGGGSAGTTPEQLAAEDARERELMIAESLARPAVAVSDKALPGVVTERPDDSAPGTPAGGVLTHLRVRALPPGGFRRAGRFWGPETVELPAEDFTVEQINALLDEPLLHVTLIGEAE